MEAVENVATVRPVIVGAWVVCLAVAAAPWFSGGQEPVALFVSTAVLLLGALLAWMQSTARRLRWGPLLWFWCGLLGFAGLSLWWSANRYSTVLWIAQWVLAGLGFRLAYTVAGEPRGREWAMRAYLVSAGLFAAAAAVMYVTTAYPRLTGTFYWPNPAAAYLIPAVVVAVDRARRAEGKRAWWWAVAAAGFLATFLLTDSRAGTLILVLVLIVYLALVKLSKATWIKLLFIIAVGYAASFGVGKLSTLTAHHDSNTVSGSRFAEVASGEPTSLRDRLDYLGSAVAIWHVHPLGGSGAGTYRDVHPQYQQQVVSASTNPHNLYVQVLAELGVVGAVALLGLLVVLFSGSLRGLAAHPEMLAVALGAAGLLLHFGVDIDGDYPALLMLAAVLLGLLYRQWWPVRGRLSLLWPAVAAAALVPTVSLYLSDGWAVRAAAAQNNGDYTSAAADYAAAHRGIVYNPDYVNAEGIEWYAVSTTAGKQARADSQRALDLAHQAEARDPYDAQHHQLEGRVLALRGDMPGAEAALQAALRLDRFNHPEYSLDLATVQLEAGQPDAAVKSAQSMLALYPPAVVANRNMDETIRPTLANLEALIGNVALVRGDLKAAAVAAKRSLYWDRQSLRGRALQVQVSKLIASKG